MNAPIVELTIESSPIRASAQTIEVDGFRVQASVEDADPVLGTTMRVNASCQVIQPSDVPPGFEDVRFNVTSQVSKVRHPNVQASQPILQTLYNLIFASYLPEQP